MTTEIRIHREDREIFTIRSLAPYWPNGQDLDVTVSFDGDILSSIKAQATLRSRGIRYILPIPYSFKGAGIIAAARSLGVDESVVVPLEG